MYNLLMCHCVHLEQLSSSLWYRYIANFDINYLSCLIPNASSLGKTHICLSSSLKFFIALMMRVNVLCVGYYFSFTIFNPFLFYTPSCTLLFSFSNTIEKSSLCHGANESNLFGHSSIVEAEPCCQFLVTIHDAEIKTFVFYMLILLFSGTGALKGFACYF